MSASSENVFHPTRSRKLSNGLSSAATSSRHPPRPPALWPVIGRASVCRRDWQSKILRIAVSALNRSTLHGAAEFAAALSEFGVRVTKRAADLTVTLANDYLERRLAELNKQRVADRTPWLLVQPSGAFPLVGPVFNPGNGPCWTCLFDRMIRNREIKGFLERGSARPVAISPLARKPLGQGAIQFAALEVAKAIATGFRTELNNHIISHDLLGSSVVKHYVATRPQCPTCGSSKLRDPRRAPKPIELGPGAKLIMTSGGYRTVSSRATVARFRKHVSPLTGVVTRLERIEADLPMNTNYFAAHNFSGPALTARRAQGGTDRRQFRQGLYRRAGRSQRADGGDRALFGDFSGRRDPNDAAVHGFSVRRCHSSQRRAVVQRRAIPGRQKTSRMILHPVPAPFDPSAKVEWSPVWSLRDQRFRYLPTSLMYFFYGGGPAPSGRYQRLRRRQHCWRKPSFRASSNWSNGMPTPSGGTIDRKGPKSTSAISMIPMFAICKPNSPTPAAGFGCSTSPATLAFRPMWRYCTGCKTDTKISNSAPARTSIAASPCCAH